MLKGLKAWLDNQKKTREARKLARKNARRYKSRVIGSIRPQSKPNKPSPVKPSKPTSVKPTTVASVVDSAVLKPHVREGTKSAVLIGLNYTGTAAALKGCINDALRMRETLQKTYQYTNVSIFTDRDLSSQNNILQVLEKLVTSNDKTLFFQYSGHGTQVRDDDSDEADGKDEALYSVNDTIVRDDDILSQVQRIKKGTTMVIVIDACHSGTMIDLPYQLFGNNILRINENKVEGDIISISGCKDTQTSADVSSGLTAYGAMSNALQKVLGELSPSTTWRLLIEKLNTELRKDRHSQISQLCVSRPELVDQIVSL